MGRIQAAALGILALAGCPQKTGPTVAPQPPADSSNAAVVDPQVEAFVTGKGEGATVDEAYTRALDDLATALLGAPQWRTLLALDLHDRSRDPFEEGQGGPTVRVAIGLDESRAAAVLAEFEYAKPAQSGPQAWHDTVYQAVTSHAALAACQQRELHFGVKCDGAQTHEQDAALAELNKGLSFEPALRGGVPVDPKGRTLRRARVMVLWHGSPLADVPLTITMPDGKLVAAKSNGAGFVDLPVEVRTQWPGPISVSADPSRLVGPLAESWESHPLTLDARPIDPTRWALVFLGDTSDDGAFAKSLGASIEPSLGPAVELKASQRRSLARADTAERARILVTLGDAMAGALDVVVFVGADARFASRAGGNRVWFEASGEVLVHEVWGAGELGRGSAEVTASGVGDTRADQAARKKLGTEVGAEVLRVLGVQSIDARVSTR